jgi:cellulose synthase (UDP-forming)
MFKKLNLNRVFVGFASMALILFLYGFIKNVGVGQPVLYVLLTIALGFKILKALFEWYHYAGLKHRGYYRLANTEKPLKTVDIFTTACPGEPYEMFEKTLKAMVAVKYPHKNYLCDEGNDPALKKLCEELGVIHVTRSTHENAKAGNINNALGLSSGEFCVILDPDHVPFPDFLDHVLAYFDNPKVGYVQIVQAYYNQAETFVARAAAEQTYMFYGPYMEAMGNYGTAQAIGANCTFRRTALESIGGHAPGLTEDMHTSMLLHAQGWESVYVPKVLSRGLVPSSISAYYKQQLKWSRGTFDLWFNLFPKLFKKFTWRQNIHYGLMPVYYLFGLIAIIDIAVPVISLFTGEYPWLLDPLIFFSYFIPFLILGLVARLYAQNWLHDPHEKGIHIFGGLLRIGTWWVYVVGFIFTLLNIKVPYIPTPKEYTPKNEFLLGLPNLLVAVLSISAAIYGILQDWQPYSILMAIFAFSNGLIFFLSFAISQTRWVMAVRESWKVIKNAKSIARYEISYHKVSLWAAPFLIVALLLSVSFLSPLKFGNTPMPEKASLEKEFGGFYLGIQLPKNIAFSENLLISNYEKRSRWTIMGMTLAWSPEKLPSDLWHQMVASGTIPLINWEPVTDAFDRITYDQSWTPNQKIFNRITSGHFDFYIEEMAIQLRSLGFPVFLSFAPEMDNPYKPYSISGENSPEEFIQAWRYIFDRFEGLGVQNVTWVWTPGSYNSLEQYFPSGKIYPESRYVDWIGIKGNLSHANFKAQYFPFQNKLNELGIALPIMISQLRFDPSNKDSLKRTKETLTAIVKDYTEIKSVILDPITTSFPQEETQIHQVNSISSISFQGYNSFKTTGAKESKGRGIIGSSGNYTMMVDGKPFYIQGVCYSAGEEWRDGYLPLTKKQLENDFTQIKGMGANTIRRYEPSIYDRNIFKAANKKGLKIMYGFWFDPDVDYYRDNKALKDYEKKVLHYVKKYKEEKSIIAWNIGNETWGLLKKKYEKPYLTLTRRAYLEFLENLTNKIHEIDPTRPVFSTEEHEYYQLPSTVYEMATYAPSLDVVGINSYYKESIEVLKKTFVKFDTLRPYAVTEFGPKGYWSQQFGDYWNDTLLVELPDLAKARWFKYQWENYIENNSGYNLGGIAFSWRDRYEGTATWFGMTDYKGRLKPSYYAMQNVWKGESAQQPEFPELTIVGHWYPVPSGGTIYFTAAITNSYSGNLRYEWEVLDEINWKKATKIRSQINDFQIVEIEVPKNTSSYRVYVYAKDELGNVVTNSRPLLLK